MDDLKLEIVKQDVPVTGNPKTRLKPQFRKVTVRTTATRRRREPAGDERGLSACSIAIDLASRIWSDIL
jgi:hypothetical protein